MFRLSDKRYGVKPPVPNPIREHPPTFYLILAGRDRSMLSLSINLCIYHTFISTSTPLGSSSFIKASMVLAVEL